MIRWTTLVIVYCLAFVAPRMASARELSLIPKPNSLRLSSGQALLGRKSPIRLGHHDLASVAQTLETVLAALPSAGQAPEMGVPLELTLQPLPNPSPEAYRLRIEPHRIEITANTPRGAYYGVMTLRQIIASAEQTPQGLMLPSLDIDDAPRYGLRALMLDPARHFLPVADLKAYIDRMSYYKFNALQLHLTDDQGWRLYVPKHPRLTELGAQRVPGGRIADNGYYTPDDLRDLVAYAAQRGIEIIPEIDVPGHTAALLVAYPELRCDIAQGQSFVLGKTDNVMLSACQKRTYEILSDVIQTLSEIFPRGTRLHLGGDESAIARNWAQSPEHQALMKRLGYTRPDELMGYFFGRVLDTARRHGFDPVLWCELDQVRLPASRYLFDYPKGVTLVTWRMGLTPLCLELTERSGHQLILAPGESAYLDYPQYRGDLPEFNNWGMPITTLERSYTWDLEHLPRRTPNHVLGVMGTLWGEAIQDIHRANYMTYPRALALAEVGWTELEHRSWEDFTRRLPRQLETLLRAGVAYRAPFEVYR